MQIVLCPKLHFGILLILKRVTDRLIMLFLHCVFSLKREKVLNTIIVSFKLKIQWHLKHYDCIYFVSLRLLHLFKKLIWIPLEQTSSTLICCMECKSEFFWNLKYNFLIRIYLPNIFFIHCDRDQDTRNMIININFCKHDRKV